jgi:hypothetical protein
VDLPKNGLGAREAVDYIEGRVHEGYVPVLTNSMYCLRRLQEYLPISIITTSNPILPIALVEARWLGGNVSWILLFRRGLDCMTFTRLYGGIEDGLRELGFFKRTLGKGLDNSRVPSNVPVHVTDIPGALEIAVKVDDSSILIVDDVDCLWDIHDQGFLRSVVIVEYPAFMIAVSDVGVSELFHLSREPMFLIVDRDSSNRECTAGSFTRKPGGLSLSEFYQHLLTLTLVDWDVINSPLEFIIKSDGLPYREGG